MTNRAAKVTQLEPRGLARAEAAGYVGIGTTLFDQLIHKGKMPQGIRLEGRVLWDRRALDRAMDELFDTPAAFPANDDKWGKVAP